MNFFVFLSPIGKKRIINDIVIVYKQNNSLGRLKCLSCMDIKSIQHSFSLVYIYILYLFTTIEMRLEKFIRERLKLLMQNLFIIFEDKQLSMAS